LELLSDRDASQSLAGLRRAEFGRVPAAEPAAARATLALLGTDDGDDA
jgi:hypothetical protein